MVKQTGGFRPDVPTSEDFTRALGQVSWLVTLSKRHRDLPISWMEQAIHAPLMLKQLRVFTKGKQPLAALTWAYASDEVKARIEAGDLALKLQDWRSGSEPVIVDCISPLTDPQIFIDQFKRDVAQAQSRQ